MKKLATLGTLLDATWELFLRHWVSFLVLSSWYLLVAFLLVIALVLYPTTGTILTKIEEAGGVINTVFSTSEYIGTILFVVINAIISPLILMWIFQTITYAISQSIKQKPINLSECYRYAFSTFLSQWWVHFLVFCTAILSFLIGSTPSIALWLIQKALIGFGVTLPFYFPVIQTLVLFFSLGLTTFLLLRWTVTYFFARSLVVTDNVKGIEALKMSRTLVIGRYADIVLRLIFSYLVLLTTMILFSMILNYLVNILLGSFDAGGMNIDLILRIATIINQITLIITDALFFPFFILFDTLLLQNLKLTK